MEQEFDPQKSKNLEIVIVNTLGEDRAVEISAYARTQNEKGQEKRIPSKDFFIIPRQTKILAGQNQTVKIIWQGSKDLLKEQAYRLIVEQLPIDLPIQNEKNEKSVTSVKVEKLKKTENVELVDDEETSEDTDISDKILSNEKPESNQNALKVKKTDKSKNQIEFLYKFVASIYARPAIAQPKIEFEVGAFDKKTQKLKLVIKNSGTAHQLLSKGKLIFNGINDSLNKILLAELPSLFNLNILAGSRIDLEIPWKGEAPPTSVSFDEKE